MQYLTSELVASLCVR